MAVQLWNLKCLAIQQFRTDETDIFAKLATTNKTDWKLRLDEMLHNDGNIMVREIANSLECGRNAVEMIIDDIEYLLDGIYAS